jgi:uncharacterized protein (TIGR01244 family)
MWPFPKSDSPRFAARRIDDTFAVTGQLQPGQMADIAAAGYRSILCARPDNEEMGQPPFSAVAEAAERAGLKAVHIPVSGGLTQGALYRMEQALAELPGPILAYCRSGARAGSLYAAARHPRA